MKVQSNVSKNRIEWIDVTRGICMFFIIIAHTGYVPSNLELFYNSFFLVAFFLLSGYMFHNPLYPFIFRQKFFKIVESLLIPYLIYWIFSYSVDSILKGNYNFIIALFYDILRGEKLWFMSCLIVSQLTLCFFFTFFNKTYFFLFFLFLNLLVWYLLKEAKLIWCIQLSFMSNIFLIIGYILRKYNSILLRKINDNFTGIIFLILWGIVLLIQYYLDYNISFPANRFGNLLVYFFYVLIGSFSVFYLSNKWTHYNKLILFLGQNSLLYYFFQNQILKVVKKILSKYEFLDESYILPLLISLFVSLFLIVPIIAINRYFSIMAGKSKFLSKRFN